MIRLLYIDLFCGAGGTSTGVENAKYAGLIDRIRKQFGISQGMTVNGENEVEVDDKGLQVLKDYEKQGLIQLRNKL